MTSCCFVTGLQREDALWEKDPDLSKIFCFSSKHGRFRLFMAILAFLCVELEWS